MQAKNRKAWLSTFLPLLGLYAACVFVRSLILHFTSYCPTVGIDEFLYYSTGRSIGTAGSLLYVGQPALYNYIIYPLILSPIYALFPFGSDYYRLIQIWNTMLMSLSVFPIYALCHVFLGDRKKALRITALFMLLPDFILSLFIYSEAVIYPLFYTMMYCVCRALKEPKIRWSVWIGVLGAVLYFAKPGAVVPAAAGLLLLAGKSFRAGWKKGWLPVLLGFAAMAATFFALKLLAEQGLGYSGEFFSVYDDQMYHYSGLYYDIFYGCAARYPYYFMLACGVLPFFLSLQRFPTFSKEDKQFYLLMAVCVLGTMIGMAWTINRPEKSTILYLRYVNMYLPLFFLYSILPEDRRLPSDGVSLRSRRITGGVCGLLLIYIVLCTVIWGSVSGIGTSIDTHFLITLAMLFTDHIMGLANIVILLLCAGTLYLLVRRLDSRIMTRICIILFAVMAVLNNTAAYLSIASNTNFALELEVKDMHRMLGDNEYLFVYAFPRCDYGLDVNSRKNIVQTTFPDFSAHLAANGGVYTPYVPASTRGMTSRYPTPDLETLVIDELSYPRIQLCSNVYRYTSKENSFRIVRFSRGQRIADSLMLNDNYPNVNAGAGFRLLVYNEEWLQAPLVLTLEIESEVEQDLVIAGERSFSIPLSAGRYKYEITLNAPEAQYTVSVQNAGIRVYTYDFAPAEAET